MKRRAISPAITSIFLIGVAVTGAITAGNIMFKQNEISQKSARLNVVDVNLVVLSLDKVYFTCTIKNTGTVPFSSTNISYMDDSGVFHSIANSSMLEPSEQFSSYSIENTAVRLGKKYLVHVEGITTTGSTYQTSTTTMAQ